jgi:predicted Zn-dependent protease
MTTRAERRRSLPHSANTIPRRHPRRVTVFAGVCLAIFVSGCDKPKIARQKPPLVSFESNLPPELVTTKLDEEVVADFSEADRKIYFDLRKRSQPIHGALVGVAYYYQNAKQHEEAARVLRRLTEIFPNFVGGWMELAGELSYFSPAEAERAVARARELYPDLRVPPPSRGLADLVREIERLIESGQVREAAAMVDAKSATADPDDWQFFRVAAQVSLLNGKPEAAVTLAERALAIRPKDEAAQLLLGSALARTGQAAKGAQILTGLEPSLGRDAMFQFELAGARLRAGQLAEAEASARQAVKLAPATGTAHRILGMALLEAQKSDEAIHELKVATELEPGVAAGWLSLANAYMQSREMNNALEASETGIALLPADPMLQTTRAQVLMLQKKWSLATLALQKALKLDADSATTWNNLGYVLLEQKRAKEALPAIERALQLKPEFRSALMNLAVASQMLGDRNRAKTALQRAKKLPLDPPQVFYHRDLISD